MSAGMAPCARDLVLCAKNFPTSSDGEGFSAPGDLF